MRKINCLVILCFCFSFGLTIRTAAQEADPVAQGRAFEQQATTAYQSKDYAAYLNYIKRAAELRPNHPRLLYNLASALALNGKTAESAAILRRLAEMGLAFRIDADADFEKLKGIAGFDETLKLFEQNQKPVNQSTVALTLPEKDLITESVAYDAKSKRFFVSSIYKRKIVVAEPGGAVKDFSSPGDGLWAVFGIKIDDKRGLLWACSAAITQMQGLLKEDKGKSAIFKYDLKTGKLLKKYLIPGNDKHLLGDLAINSAGDVFATDSVSAFIYRINSKKDEIEEFLTDKSFNSLQGLTFSPDEKSLFIADYSTGISRIDLNTKKINRLSIADKITVLGIDGLYFYHNKLIATQNGVSPQRVVEFDLSMDGKSLTGFKTMEANHSVFPEPTLGVIVGNYLYFIANGQMDSVNEKGEIAAPEKLRSPIILRVKL